MDLKELQKKIEQLVGTFSYNKPYSELTEYEKEATEGVVLAILNITKCYFGASIEEIKEALELLRLINTYPHDKPVWLDNALIGIFKDI